MTLFHSCVYHKNTHFIDFLYFLRIYTVNFCFTKFHKILTFIQITLSAYFSFLSIISNFPILQTMQNHIEDSRKQDSMEESWLQENGGKEKNSRIWCENISLHLHHLWYMACLKWLVCDNPLNHRCNNWTKHRRRTKEGTRQMKVTLPPERQLNLPHRDYDVPQCEKNGGVT